MSFQRKMDGQNGVFSRVIAQFSGWHSGYSKPDEPNAYARVCDFDCSQKHLELRDGCRKNQGWGYSSDITDVFSLTIGGRKLLGQVSNGVLNVYPVEDILEGIRKYYTIQEGIDDWTISDATAKTINDFIKGNR